MTETAAAAALPDYTADAARAAAAWGWSDAVLRPVTGGLINHTFAVELGGAPVAVLQRLHPVFAPEVNLDIDAVTSFLATKGVLTPRLVRTAGGSGWVTEAGATWRAMTWVDGLSVHTVPSPTWAESGGELVGQFHRAMIDFQHDYKFSRPGVHDTDAHLAKLSAILDARPEPDARTSDLGPAAGGSGQWSGTALLQKAEILGHEILAAAQQLPALPDGLPLRHCHGDLKISNVLFQESPPVARALVDLDTIGTGTIALEIGDAMRSWCNPRGEDAGAVRFDLVTFAAAMRGYRFSVRGLFDRAELTSIVIGLERVCIELAARFCTDIFEDRYFGWDPTRFASRPAHNLVRARGQLELAQAVTESRAAALDALLG
jgi:Ser/Thr protein kinase RdoA (MazF antagonist)